MNKNIDSIKDYFTEDVRERVQKMTNEEMKNALKSLEGTQAWFAILKYNQERIATVQNSFLVLDPVKEPSKISQYQGIITGMLDIQDAVLSLKYESLKVENKDTDKDINKDELGGAYGKF